MKTFKAKIRIPTDSYAYIELEYEGTSSQIFGAYEQFMQVFKDGQNDGIPSKEFNAAVDGYFLKGTMTAEVYESMGKDQKIFIQTCKRSFKRIQRNSKEEKEVMIFDETPTTEGEAPAAAPATEGEAPATEGETPAEAPATEGETPAAE